MTRWKSLMIAGLATLALALPVQPLSSPADARGGGHGGGGHGGGGHGGGHRGGGGGHRGGGHFGRGGGVHIRIGVRGGGRGGYRRGGGGWHGGYGGYRVVRSCPWHFHWSWRFGRCIHNF